MICLKPSQHLPIQEWTQQWAAQSILCSGRLLQNQTVPRLAAQSSALRKESWGYSQFSESICRTSLRAWNFGFKNNTENLALISSIKSALFWGQDPSPPSRPYNSPFWSFSAHSCDVVGRYWRLGDFRGNFRFIQKYAHLYFHIILLILTEMDKISTQKLSNYASDLMFLRSKLLASLQACLGNPRGKQRTGSACDL